MNKMNLEKEITIEGDTNIETLQKILEEQVFIIQQEYDVIDIDEMINALKQYHIPKKGDNYFAKKAKLALKELFNK